MERESTVTAQPHRTRHAINVLNDFRIRQLNEKDFGGDYQTSHAEINLLFHLKLLTPTIARSGYNRNTKNLPNRYIRKYRRNIPKIIYVIRVGPKGKLMYSRPCAHCLIVLKRIGIKYVVYSADRHSFVKERLT